LPDEFYVPDLDRIQYQSTSNKQGSAESLPVPMAQIAIDEIDDFCNRAYALYEKFIEQGVAREIARSVLPVNIYTEWYWVQNLHNLFHFLSLRKHSHAQHEIQVYAEAIWNIVQDWVPAAAGAFEDYRLNAVSFSAQEASVIRVLISGALGVWDTPDPHVCLTDQAPVLITELPAQQRIEFLESHGLTNKRERLEFWKKVT